MRRDAGRPQRVHVALARVLVLLLVERRPSAGIEAICIGIRVRRAKVGATAIGE